MWEGLCNSNFASDIHVLWDFNHLVETEFPLVHEIHHFRGDRHLVGAGHGEALITIERDDLVAADFLCSHTNAANQPLRKFLNLLRNDLSYFVPELMPVELQQMTKLLG